MTKLPSAKPTILDRGKVAGELIESLL
jgi:hypothetical protein